MGGVLEQRIAAQPHQGEDAQGQQGDGHDHDLGGDAKMQPHQLRVAHEQQQGARLDGVARLQHPAQQLAGIGVVGRDGIYVAELLIFCHGLLLLPGRVTGRYDIHLQVHPVGAPELGDVGW